MPLTWKIQPTPSVIEVPTKLNDKLENGTENNNAPASASGLVSQNSSLSRRNASFMEPFKIAFLPNPGGFPGPGRDFWDNQDYILTTIFMVDVMLRFTVANTKNAETEILARDHRTIALNYVRGIFLFDLLFCMPIDWIVEAAVQAAYPYDYGNVYAAANGQLLLWVSTIKFIKMGRMYRVLLFFNNLDKKMVLSEIALMLIRNWLYVLYSSHWGACIFYLIARLEMFSPQSWVGRAQNRMDGTSTADRYIYSLYVSMSVFIGSLGDNDFYEASVAEAAFMILYCLLNVVLSAYILGTVTMLMVKFDERSKALRDKKTNLIAFKKMHDISDDLYIAMKEHLELHFHSEQTADENVLSVYPATLRRKVLRELYMENLKACYLFGSSKAKFLDAILAIARVELFLPYVELIQQGDIVQELYIVMEGEVQVLVRQMGGLEKGPDQSFVASKKSFKAIASQVSGALAFAKKSIYGAPLELSNSQNIKSTTLNIVNATETRYAAETFGEVSFFTEMPSPEGAMTAISSRIMVISKSEFEGLSTVFPNATRAVLDALLTRTEEDLEFELEAVAPTYRTAIIRKFSNFLLPTEKIKLEPGDLDPEVCDKIVSELNPSQVLKLEMLSRINKAVKHHYEQLDLSRVSKLLNHVAKNNTTDVKRMLSQGLNPDTCAHHDKRTALMIAASEGHLAMCQLLLDSGANPMARDRFERTPLLDAVQLGHDNIILLLRKYRATLRGDSLLAAGEMLNAVCSGDIVLLRRYLRAGADPDAMDCDSRTALHLAASEGDVKLTRLLIEEGGATVDLKDRWGHTPLDNARMFNIQPMIDYLGPIMEASVQLRATTVEHARVAKWLGAASVGNLSLMNKMLKEQVDPNISCKANGGRTAMMLAATEGHEEIVLRLLEANARVDICDDSGCSLLFHAAHACREDLVNMLVDRGVTLFMNDQLVAYHMCTAAKGNYAFLRCLIKAGADPKIPLMGASSPLHCAAAADCVKSLRVLVEEGHISPDTRSPHGTTALYEAQAAGALKAVKYLNRALGTDPLISPVWPAGIWTGRPRRQLLRSAK
ncbi:hypothetical protein CEUSTIGMA_g3951.t1 [Chlamydomonas eustigma]|uniref:Cyclic nucleotide-binding domain-containing protein n=1 Tax=Chlamydomonas eustigma TaxID=1157962 RepID=A0A250X0C3_9CHLO|nr:hypothetical protein CEUSTIGMA_g3951.t1 [Chlamydomonas eustigma]|eukprot:GAX76506.1 hypothetical protein CEUSTIGMA_g3951.t1 [Chlamydomonas eustigma]